MDYANKVLDELEMQQVFVLRSTTRAEKIGYKIREAQMQKIPYMLVVGEKEAGGRSRISKKPFCRR